MVGTLLAGAEPSTVAKVVATAEGNPLFIEELVAALGDETGDGELPATVRAAIAARIDALPPDARTALLHASVIGQSFWSGVLDEIGELGDVETSLEALEARGLVRRHPHSQVEGDVEFAFKHVLIRDVAYATLPRGLRRELHATAARVIEASVPDPTELAWVLAYHWREGGEPARAIEYLLAAGDRARAARRRRGDVRLLHACARPRGDRRGSAPDPSPSRRVPGPAGGVRQGRQRARRADPGARGPRPGGGAPGTGAVDLLDGTSGGDDRVGASRRRRWPRRSARRIWRHRRSARGAGPYSMRGEEGDLERAIEMRGASARDVGAGHASDGAGGAVPHACRQLLLAGRLPASAGAVAAPRPPGERGPAQRRVRSARRRDGGTDPVGDGPIRGGAHRRGSSPSTSLARWAEATTS